MFVWPVMTRVVLGVLGYFWFCLQNMSHTSSIYHLNAHPHWITWLRRRPCFMRFFRQIFRFFEIFFCLEVPGVAHIYSIIPWHLGNISRIYRFCGTLWKKNYDRLKNGHFFDFLLISKKTQLVTPHSNRNDLTIPMSRKKRHWWPKYHHIHRKSAKMAKFGKNSPNTGLTYLNRLGINSWSRNWLSRSRYELQ